MKAVVKPFDSRFHIAHGSSIQYVLYVTLHFCTNYKTKVHKEIMQKVSWNCCCGIVPQIAKELKIPFRPLNYCFEESKRILAVSIARGETRALIWGGGGGV